MESCELEELVHSLNVLCLSPCLNLGDCSRILKRLVDCCRNERRKSVLQVLDASHWHILLKLAGVGATLLKKEVVRNEDLDFLSDLLRCLRNICAGCSCENQSLMSSTDLLSAARGFLLSLVRRRQSSSEKETVVLRCCLQLFGNLVCQSESSKHIVWKLFIEEGIFRLLLEDKDPKVQEYCMMILYNCMIPEYQQQILNTVEGHKVLLALMNSLYENVIDWGILITECILSNEDFMEKGYAVLPIRNRLLVLDVIAEQMDNMEVNSQCIPEVTLQYIKQHFIDSVLDIVKTCETYSGDLKSIEITKLLSILCAASVANRSSCIIKSYKDLLEVAIEILKSVHLLGKQSCNAFSAVPSLKGVNNLSKDDIEFHPSFGFKKNLIRLIGNMCFECRENQDLVREMDGIPLFLDCCNLDVRNPYIIQWCVLAIRNIMENNAENQAVLASISVTAEMANSSLLQELGLTVEVNNGYTVLKATSNKARESGGV